jgi:hypothetical protein
LVLQLGGKSSGGKGSRGKKPAAAAAAAAAAPPSESEGSGSEQDASSSGEEEQQPQPKKQSSTGKQRGRPRKPQHPARSMLDEASNGIRERKVRMQLCAVCCVLSKSMQVLCRLQVHLAVACLSAWCAVSCFLLYILCQDIIHVLNGMLASPVAVGQTYASLRFLLQDEKPTGARKRKPAAVRQVSIQAGSFSLPHTQQPLQRLGVWSGNQR